MGNIWKVTLASQAFRKNTTQQRTVTGSKSNYVLQKVVFVGRRDLCIQLKNHRLAYDEQPSVN